MLCSLLTMVCIAGGVEFSPNVFKVELIDAFDGVIYEVTMPTDKSNRFLTRLGFDIIL